MDKLQDENIINATALDWNTRKYSRNSKDKTKSLRRYVRRKVKWKLTKCIGEKEEENDNVTV